jgi:hypothetical protein
MVTILARYVLIGAAMLVATSATAQSLRCGTALVKSGDSRTAVEETCGEPKTRIRQVNDEGATVGWRYVYDGGYGAADRSVTFRHGKVVAIRRND